MIHQIISKIKGSSISHTLSTSKSALSISSRKCPHSSSLSLAVAKNEIMNPFNNFSAEVQKQQQCHNSITKRYNETAATNKKYPRQPYKNKNKFVNKVNDKIPWVSFQDIIPKFSSLSDLLLSIEETIELIKLEKDLFASETTNITTTATTTLPNHLVLDARIQLSNLKRFHGWYLRFPSHLIAQSFVDYYDSQYSDLLEYHKRNSSNSIRNTSNIRNMKDAPEDYHHNGPKCYTLSQQEVKRDVAESDFLNLNESVLRLEHAPKHAALTDIYHLLRHWEFSNIVDKPIVPVKELCRYPVRENSFIIYMEDAANARSVVRELQCCDFKGHSLTFTRFPDQLISGLDLVD